MKSIFDEINNMPILDLYGKTVDYLKGHRAAKLQAIEVVKKHDAYINLNKKIKLTKEDIERFIDYAADEAREYCNDDWFKEIEVYLRDIPTVDKDKVANFRIESGEIEMKTLNIESIMKAYPCTKDFGLMAAQIEDDGDLRIISEHEFQIDLYGITDEMIIEAGL